ncbi:UDP-N-acetylglucosamine--LPS N-acetylglucosamine transferase [Pseudoalteromonas sp. NEC-BIFX-2020_015]|uniref:UDP-N-acetylglucosamine--LPS N-acetylglucosamine transferase n=1 Tax=Pseudoalteromonas sp. NEC-BIFX-2020_015 TaxID=2729544 RepID=UPI001461666E|nr:UDP-N-acetylglucosamine--LPS N-acetylglucosamine transferase [Pseudoalteromonas sp. NEC-BIFX-2020_015]NMR23956.1 UDP-N-acetylglucosamine--LPS N-acetylglucosamine transferase [Pseudoalteromonas sp. NEC-BIFX-2020_015]
MKKKRVMAIASRGGHWIQLNRLSAVWEDHDVVFITNDASLKSHVGNNRFETVIDANMDQKFKLILLAAQTCFKVLKHRPHVIISTGAAPGFFALLWGKLIGAKTVWVDSVANAEELSLAGSKVSKLADVWLTQWPEVAKENGPIYKGRVF